MSFSFLHVPPGTTIVPWSNVTPLTPEAENALLTRAKDIIAGRVAPPELPIAPEIENFLKREFDTSIRPQHPTPFAA